MLICDDDSMTLRVLEFQFRKDGFEVLKANNGRDAQKILQEVDDIDVLITDIYMPLSTGLELVTYVRKDLNRKIPIVVLSRVNVEDTMHHAFDLDANEYILKPVNLENISKKVKQLLNIDE